MLKLKLSKQRIGNRRLAGILATSLTFGAGVSGGGESMDCESATAFAALDLLGFFGLTSELNWSSGRTARNGT